MSSGHWILLILIILFILISLLAFYCHFFGESGGRSFETLAGDKPRVIVFTKKKCTCDKSFKGLCKHCEVTDDFVGADGGVRTIKDFTEFGGDQGFDSQTSSGGDPIRGFLGGQSGQGGHQAGGSDQNGTVHGYESSVSTYDFSSTFQ